MGIQQKDSFVAKGKSLVPVKNFFFTCGILLLSAIFFSSPIQAQEGIYIGSATNIFVHSDTLSIIGNVQNKGHFGSKPGSVIRFLGQIWFNDTTATLPDERSYLMAQSIPSRFDGVGGQFWLTQAWISSPQSQFIQGGYSVLKKKGASFPNLKVDNARDIYLTGDIDAQIRNNLQLENGHIWLAGRNLVMGITNPGTITGYDHNKYIITGVDINGGFLYRSKLNRAAGTTVFPVGANNSQYTPADILHTGLAEDFKVRAFNDLYTLATTGLPGGPPFVRNTWNIGKETLEDSATIVRLQHPSYYEGTAFSGKRDSAYITFFNKDKQFWDTIQPAGATIPGTITTGALQSDAYINIRTFIRALGTNEFLGKSVNNSTDYLGTQLSLIKKAKNPQLQIDGSYNVQYTLLIKNQSRSSLNYIRLSDNLRTTFPSPLAITVAGVTVSGKLVANAGYDGITDTVLISTASRMDAGKEDTVVINVNVKHNNVFGTFYNTAIAEGQASTANAQVSVVSANGSSVDASGNPIPSGTPVTINPLDVRPSGGFSPNNDGVNDRFVIANTSTYNVTLEVVDRWGNKVFMSRGNYNNDWDGTSNQPGSYANSRLPDGTYFYNITLFNKQTGARVSSLVGFVTLKR